jgi:hypothetical protein
MNKMGQYIFNRICKDQEALSRVRPRNMYGLYINSKDIQNYVHEYTNYGIDWDGEECADDKIERYWDEPDGHEN